MCFVYILLQSLCAFSNSPEPHDPERKDYLETSLLQLVQALLYQHP